MRWVNKFGFALVLALALAPAASAATRAYAPGDRAGPKLSVPAAGLPKNGVCKRASARADRAGPKHSVRGAAREKNVVCKRVTAGGRSPILLVPGTTLKPDQNFAWNYERAFDALGFPYCTVELPFSAMGDIQVAGE